MGVGREGERERKKDEVREREKFEVVFLRT
jgi:hypothetical protein